MHNSNDIKRVASY